MNVSEMVGLVETAGAKFRLNGEKVRVCFPAEQRREELAEHLAFLRDHRDEVATFLRTRNDIPRMLPGLRLVEWKLKEPPIAIETCAVVIDANLFARTTLEQLRIAIANPRRWVGWSVPQLVDRLTQVGVTVSLLPSASSEKE